MTESPASNGVCAVVTTFRPDPDVLRNIELIRAQVQSLVVVDNGSAAEAVELLTDLSEKLNFGLIANSCNLGIATALNLGSHWAIQRDLKFLLYFDQDSTATAGMVTALLETYHSEACMRPIGLVATTNRERQPGPSQPPLHDSKGMPVVVTTSGSLLPVEIFEKCGQFEEDMFIEFVDHEYCLRLRSKGYQLVICNSAILLHDVGFPRTHSFLGLFRCRCTHHRAARRYYFVRNFTTLFPRYWLTEREWCITELSSLFKSTLKICLFEEDRITKLQMSWRGLLDGITHAMGERVKL